MFVFVNENIKIKLGKTQGRINRFFFAFMFNTLVFSVYCFEQFKLELILYITFLDSLFSFLYSLFLFVYM